MTIIAIMMWLVIAPFCLGLSLARWMKKEYQNIAMIMVLGDFIMLAMFQLVYLPFIVFYNHFEPLVKVYSVLIALLAVLSLIINGKYWIKWQKQQKIGLKKEKVGCYMLWMVALLLIGFQLYKAVFYQFQDGDDAFYAVTSVITNTTKNMYMYLPYTGESSLLDKRHAFSAAPVFISFLASVLGLHPTIVTHVVYSVWILILTYLIYKLIGDMILEKSNVPLFLIFLSIINMFGNSTIYTSATFLLTRTGQGKAFLSNIIPAAGILGLLFVWKDVRATSIDHSGEKGNRLLHSIPWIFLSLVMITAVYTSLMGILLAAMLVGGVTLLLVIIYKRISLLVACMCAMTPLLVIGLLYMKVLFNL